MSTCRPASWFEVVVAADEIHGVADIEFFDRGRAPAHPK